MENLVVDEKHLKSLVKAVEGFKETIDRDLGHLKDEKADIFNRYMAYNRVRNLMKATDLVMSIAHKSMIAGHNLQDELFHTEAGKKNGWDEVKVADHPFFVDGDDDKKEDGDNVPDFLKSIIAGAVLGAIVGKSK